MHFIQPNTTVSSRYNRIRSLPIIIMIMIMITIMIMGIYTHYVRKYT
jgi:hypothetical protein